MRLLSSFLTIVVLFLLAQPVCSSPQRAIAQADCCSGSDDGCDDEVPGAGNDEDCSGCNPFQSCSCCVVALNVPAVPQIVMTAEALTWSKEKLAFSISQLQRPERSGIWQPPRRA